MTDEHSSPHRPAPEWTLRVARERRREADKLVSTLMTSKFVEIPLATTRDLANWRKTVDFAKRHGLVPPGNRLEKQMLGDKLLRIKLVAGTHANTKKVGELAPVPIPVDLRALHPSVAAIRDANDQLQIPKHLRRRALIVLQAAAAELERRGLSVVTRSGGSSGRGTNHYYGVMATKRACRIETVIGGVSSSLSIAQNSPFSNDAERADRLAIEISPWHQGRHAWVDGKRRRIEDRLGEVLAALEAGAAEAKKRREEQEQHELRRRARWEAAMEQARHLAIEDRYLRVLRQKVEEWRFAEDLQLYARALRRRLMDLQDRDQAKAAGWLEWASRFLERYDVLDSLPELPDRDAEPTSKELEPHLGGLSPYGP